jgi:hypothetical protein
MHLEKMRMNNSRVLVVALLVLLPSLAWAQAETTSRLSGTVVDEAGQPVAQAKVVLTSRAMQGERETTTDDQGKFLEALLPPGLYIVTISAADKTPKQYTIRLSVGQTVPLNAVLKAGTDVVEEVNVFAPAAKMQTTAGGETFNYRNQIDMLPVTNRTLDNVANLAPNVSFGPTAASLSISGAPSYDNSVLLDGADISDPYYSGGTVVYLEEAIDEVQVMTNGVSARYGRFQGGVINATTKSGGNTFDGTFRTDLSKDSWNSKTPFGEGQANDLNKVYSATFGGPILKDHLWFYLGGRTIPSTSEAHTQLVIPGDFTSETSQDRYLVKLTGALSSRHTLEGSYEYYDNTVKNYDPFDWVAEPNAIIPERADPRKFYTAEYQGVLTEKTFINAQYARKKVSIESGGDPTLPSPILELFGGVYQAYANGWFDPNDPSVRDNESAAISATHSLNAGSWGAHTLEYGLQYVNSITSGDNRQSPTGYNLYFNQYIGSAPDEISFADCSSGTCLFDLDPANWFTERLKAIPGAGEQNLKNTALYIEDGWEIGKWRLDLGLRWEKWKGEAISPAMNLDFDALSPRIGVTYNLTPAWQVQGTYGKYVSRFNDNVANGVSGISSIFGPGILQEYIGPVVADQTAQQIDAILHDDANWGAILGYVNPLQPTTFFADNVTAPYANDFNLSIKRALPKNQGTVTVTYTKRSFQELLDNFVGGVGTVTIVLPDTTTTDVDQVIWDNCNTCRRDYESLTATWDYRPSVVWNVGGNYAYSTTEGNYEGEANGQPSIGSIIGNYPNDIDPEKAYPYGYLNGDVRHRFRGWGNYRFDLGRPGKLTLGGILFYNSGSAYSHTQRIPAGTDPAYLGAPSTYTAFFGGRGSHRFEGAWNLDTSVRYDVAVHKDVTVYAKLNVINITNNDSLIKYRTNGTVQTGPGGLLTFLPTAGVYGTPSSDLSYQTPRTITASVGVNW